MKFQDLVRIMMDADLEATGLPAAGECKHYFADGQYAWLRKP